MSNIHSVPKLVKMLRDAQEDFEFYPTTSEIADCIKADMLKHFSSRDGECFASVLDVGCGNGSLLKNLTKGKKYGIEKSRILIEQLDPDIFIVGTDFEHQTLIDKKTDVLVMNPIYSKFSEFTYKAIKECASKYAYFIIPQRWQQNTKIQEAIELRSATTSIIGEYDFLEADRPARAKVHVVKVSFVKETASYYDRDKIIIDPFELWFAENFPFQVSNSKAAQADLETRINEIKSSQSDVVKSDGLVQILERFYNRDLNKLMTNYLKFKELDADLLEELGVKTESVCEGLQHKIERLKDRYWRELFDNLETITSRLTYKSREELLKTLLENTHVDFSIANAEAVVLWVINNSNKYFNNQFIDTYMDMVEKASIINYKSNDKVFGEEEGWRYTRYSERNDLTHYKLDYRFILHRIGGLETSSWSYDSVNGLSKRAAKFLSDVITCAGNIGFDTANTLKPYDFKWYSNKSVTFYYLDTRTNTEKPLLEVKAFLNGNLHLKFCPDLICRFNVEFGRLRGWVRNAQEAAEELDIKLDLAEQSFNSTLRIRNEELPKLLMIA